MAERQMIVLTNATPLIVLARRGHFDLLRLLYGTILLPPAVYREVVLSQGVLATGLPSVCLWSASQPMRRNCIRAKASGLM